MFVPIRKRTSLYNFTVLGALSFVFAIAGFSSIQTQSESPYIGLVRLFDPDFTMPHAAGLAFSPLAEVFLASASASVGQPGEGSTYLTSISPFEEWMSSADLPPIGDPINMTFDRKGDRLLLFDTANQELILIDARPDGYIDPDAITRVEANAYGIQDPQGMAVDPLAGTLFILSVSESQIVCVEPDEHGNFDGSAALAEGRISRIDLTGLNLGVLQGLAFNPSDGHLHILNPVRWKLYEVSDTGQLVATRDLSALDLAFRDQQGFVFAPSADLTDDPAQLHLYLMDSGLGPLSTDPFGNKVYLPFVILAFQGDRSSLTRSWPLAFIETAPADQGPGRIFEFSLTPPGLNPHQDTEKPTDAIPFAKSSD